MKDAAQCTNVARCVRVRPRAGIGEFKDRFEEVAGIRGVEVQQARKHGEHPFYRIDSSENGIRAEQSSRTLGS